MPVYEYQCTDCKTTFTVTQSIADHLKRKKRPTCTKCGSSHTRQLLSAFIAKTGSKT